MTDQLEEHRTAWRVVVDEIPGSEFLSHADVDNPDWELVDIRYPAVGSGPLTGCKTCGDPPEVVGLTVKCRDLHEVCKCGARYDEPKAKGCRRRKHPKEEK
jgi:hypothetical protein